MIDLFGVKIPDKRKLKKLAYALCATVMVCVTGVLYYDERMNNESRALTVNAQSSGSILATIPKDTDVNANQITNNLPLSETNESDIISSSENMTVINSDETIDNSSDTAIDSNQSTDNTQNSKININSASKEELMSLPGIGAVKAENIIEYRKENGDFELIEDIMRVSGIAEGIFDKINGLIRVN